MCGRGPFIVTVRRAAAGRQNCTDMPERFTYGVHPSHDVRRICVRTRGEVSVSVLDALTLHPVARWRVAPGSSPDMGGVTANGRDLWFSGRCDSRVYVIDTVSGRLTHRIGMRPVHTVCSSGHSRDASR